MNDLDKPNLTEAELFHYLRYEEELIGVTRSNLRWAVRRREIRPTRLGNRHLFSKRDGLAWVESRRQIGKYEATPLRVPAD